MALPVAKTPVLTGEEAAKFLTTLHENAEKPVGPVPTPELEKARETIKKHCENGQKHVH